MGVAGRLGGVGESIEGGAIDVQFGIARHQFEGTPGVVGEAQVVTRTDTLVARVFAGEDIADGDLPGGVVEGGELEGNRGRSVSGAVALIRNDVLTQKAKGSVVVVPRIPTTRNSAYFSC